MNSCSIPFPQPERPPDRIIRAGVNSFSRVGLPSSFLPGVIRVLLLFICVCILPFESLSQTAYDDLSKKNKKRFDEALEFYYGGNQIEDAIPLLNKLLEDEVAFIDGWLLLGDLYSMSGDDRAVDAYKSAIDVDPDYSPYIYKALGNAEFGHGDYEDAYNSYAKFIDLETDDADAVSASHKKMDICRFRRYAIDNPVDFQLQNLGETINSKHDEYVNALTADEEMLFFTRRKERKEYVEGEGKQFDEYFMQSLNESGQQQQATLLDPPFSEIKDAGGMCVSPDGRYIFFTSCFRSDSYGSCDLYFSKRLEHSWSEPVNIGSKVNSESWDSQPALSPDGRTLYFVSNRPGGQGSSDIWKTEIQSDGSFGKAVNLGSLINTDAMEMAPFIHFDNNSLYFSSAGHTGMGGMDLFISKRDEDGNFTQVVNLGYPLNTEGDELNLIVNSSGKTAFISAERDEGIGSYDIYSFDLPENARPQAVTYLKGVVYDSLTKENLKAEIRLLDVETSEIVMSALSDPTSGRYLVCVPSDMKYALNVSAKKYLFYSSHIDLKGEHGYHEPFVKDVPLQPIQPGSSIVLNNVFYEVDSHALNPDSYAELDRLALFLTDNPGIKLEVSGHTDNTGTEAYNLELSEKRAESVVEYLLGLGINTERLSAVGYGFSKAVASNDTEEGRALNRRTGIRVLGLD